MCVSAALADDTLIEIGTRRTRGILSPLKASAEILTVSAVSVSPPAGQGKSCLSGGRRPRVASFTHTQKKRKICCVGSIKPLRLMIVSVPGVAPLTRNSGDTELSLVHRRHAAVVKAGAVCAPR